MRRVRASELRRVSVDIGAGHEDDGRGGAPQDPAELAIGRVHDRLDGEVGGQQVGKEHDIGRPDDRALDAFLGPGVGGVGQVKREGAFDQAIGQLAVQVRERTSSAASTVSGIDGLTVSVAAMSATFGDWLPEGIGDLDRTAEDIDSFVQARAGY